MAVWTSLLNLLFPPVCVGCGKCLPPLANPTPIFCDQCLPIFEQRYLPLPAIGEDMPVDGVVGPISLVSYAPHATAGVAEKLIYHIKRHNDSRVFAHVAEELAGYVSYALAPLGIPMGDLLLTYPPRRRSAKRKNGFDQAERLCHFLAKAMDVEEASLIVRTGKRVKAQKQLNAKERAESATLSYVLDEDISFVKGRVVLLTDDLYTTGATLKTCADLLLDAGALLVVMVTVGKTQG